MPSLLTSTGSLTAASPGQRLLALPVLALLAYALLQFPLFRGWIGILLLLYMGLNLYRPGSWLWLLPALLPLANNAPWTGRFFLTEFDFLIWATVAVALFQGQYRRTEGPALTRPARLAIGLLAVSHLISLAIGAWPLPTDNANRFFSYYSHYNALRVEKGFFYALLLYFPLARLYRLDPEGTIRRLTTGILVGVCLMGLVVLWERGTITDILYAGNRYEFFRSLLNFSTAYRITAWFPEMHSGGTAIDGYLILCWPVTLWCALAARGRALQILGFTAFLACSYATLVTFSRGVVFGMLVALMIIIVGYLLALRVPVWRRTSLAIGLQSLLLAGVLMMAYGSGGTLAIAGIAALALAAYLAGCAPLPALDRYRWHALIPAGLLLGFFTLRALTTSQWHSHGLLEALLITLGLCLAGGYTAYRLGHHARALPQRRTAVLVGTGFILFTTLMTFGVGGYRMTERLAGAGADLAHRAEHWNTALDIMDRDPLTQLFGMGAGRFPETYLFRANAPTHGTFQFVEDPVTRKPLLELGGGKDARIGQRIRLDAEHPHRLTITARTDDPQAMLYVRICRRHLIHPNEWNPTCLTVKEVLEASGDGGWTTISQDIPAGYFRSKRPIGQPPLTLTVSNRREYAFALRPPTLLQVDSVHLVDTASGEEITRNGDFRKGGDHWFPYFDFNHLPWHIKNLWLAIHFDSGLLGLAAALLSLFAVVHNARRQAAAHHYLPLYLTAAVLGFYAVGTFGTLVDTPRIAFLYYALLLLALRVRRQETISNE